MVLDLALVVGVQLRQVIRCRWFLAAECKVYTATSLSSTVSSCHFSMVPLSCLIVCDALSYDGISTTGESKGIIGARLHVQTLLVCLAVHRKCFAKHRSSSPERQVAHVST